MSPRRSPGAPKAVRARPREPGARLAPGDRDGRAGRSRASATAISTSGSPRPARSSTGPPATTHPDHVSYERIEKQGWAVALPAGNALFSLLAGEEPSRVYGALAALLTVLIPLAGYVCARACLEWNIADASLLAGSVLAINSNLLFAGYYGWHGALAGTAFALVAAVATTARARRSPRAVVATRSPARCSSPLRSRRIACRSHRSSSPGPLDRRPGLSRVQSLHPDRPSTGASGRAVGGTGVTVDVLARRPLDRRTRPAHDLGSSTASSSSPAGWGKIDRGGLGSGNRTGCRRASTRKASPTSWALVMIARTLAAILLVTGVIRDRSPAGHRERIS